ncbi:MAG: DUF779 domain-containing protein [Hydrogenimonas sp.]|nr:DUF779 domain-containing protein [Hydrogenimonas sp.]
MPFKRIDVTEAAEKVIKQLQGKHGKLIFHMSGGCCDGSAPMCFEEGDFLIGSRDIKLGSICGCDFYMSEDLFEYMKNTHITIDITEGRGSSFSLEIPLGVRFVAVSRLFTPEEESDLEPIVHNS